MPVFRIIITRSVGAAFAAFLWAAVTASPSGAAAAGQPAISGGPGAARFSLQVQQGDERSGREDRAGRERSDHDADRRGRRQADQRGEERRSGDRRDRDDRRDRYDRDRRSDDRDWREHRHEDRSRRERRYDHDRRHDDRHRREHRYDSRHRDYGHYHGRAPRRGHGYYCNTHFAFHYYRGYDPVGWRFAVHPGRYAPYGCRTVERIEYRRGRRIVYGALQCLDPWGYPYIVRGSEYVYRRYYY